jgi:ABC-type proline/glycine betaine transport system permease subunit
MVMLIFFSYFATLFLNSILRYSLPFLAIVIIALLIAILLCLIFGLSFYKNRKKAKRVTKSGLILTTVALIIALGLVLIFFLYSSNLESRTVFPTTCISESNYYCQDANYKNASDSIFVTLGQETGTNWTSANFMYVPQNQTVSSGLPVTLTYAAFRAGLGNTTYSAAGLASGQTINVWLPVNGITGHVPIGTETEGTIWAQYTTKQSGAAQYVQMGSLRLPAT